MKVTKQKDQITMIAAIIDPHHFTLWARYVEDRINEGKSMEEAVTMSDYNYKKDIELAVTKATLIIRLLDVGQKE